jgi:endonuclease III
MRSLAGVVRELGAIYGQPVRNSLSAFELIILENACYLVDDERRWRVFEALRGAVGITPRALLRKSAAELAAIIREGGMKPALRAEKVLECARVAEDIGLDELEEAVERRDLSAKKLLRRFPGIGEPSADKIMLLCAALPCLAPDSNALRVLVRLGFVEEKKNYAEEYRLAVRAAEFATADEAHDAHVLLRKHGKEVCRRSSPRCDACPLRSQCRWYRETVGVEVPTIGASR